ncbi:hypothetical protein Sbs19_41560 [Sphingobium sp. BS19]|nr:hypothetical protein Sbs19_41560 [Sphingobium sp. BS19]
MTIFLRLLVLDRDGKAVQHAPQAFVLDVFGDHLAARKGEALIWCANLLHGGSHQNDPRLTRWSQVTHYFFDDCIYYTPAFSDEAIGKLDLRNVVAISDGEPRPNQYLGEKVQRLAIAGDDATRRPLWLRRLKRIFG